jgi:hypothetical protein
MAERITVHFDAKGDKRLVTAINSLARAQGRLARTTDHATSANMRNRVSARKSEKSFMALGGTMAVIRSRLLVYGFAAALVNKTIGKSIRLAMTQEDAERKLAVQLGYTSNSLLKYAEAQQKVTQFGDEQVLSVMGSLSAFTKNEEEIKKLTKATLDLSEGMGMGLDEAALLVGKTFGSTTNSMSRYGVAVKGAQGSTKRLESLTDNVALKYGGLSEKINTTSKALKQMCNALGDAGEEIGKAFLPRMKEMAMDTTRFVHNKLIPSIQEVTKIDFGKTADNMKENIKVVQEFLARFMGLLPNLFAGIVHKIVLLIIDAFKKLKDNVGIFFEGFGTFLFNNARLMGNHFLKGWRHMANGFKNLMKTAINEAIINPMNAVIDMMPEKANKMFGVEGFQPFKMTKVDTSDLDEAIHKIHKEILSSDIFQSFLESSKDTFNKDLPTVLAEFAKMYDETLGTLVINKPDLFGNFGKKKDPGSGFFSEENKEKLKAMAEEWGQYQDAIMGVANAFEEMQMASINATLQEELAAANSIKNTKKRERAIKAAKDKAHKEEMKLKKDMQIVRIAEAISNTALGITKALADPGGIPGTILAALIGVTGAMQVATIKAQKFEQGGLIGGNLHSQGGTMIEAERGEFVMSRKAVDAVGVETMNQINSGKVGSNINVSFAGNVMSDDFVENEAIPKIKDAIRRGADIGVN